MNIRNKTPKNAPSKFKFGGNSITFQKLPNLANLNKKNEDVLYRIANKLENIVSDFNAQSDIKKVIKQLKTIVLNIYKFIDDKENKNSTKEETIPDNNSLKTFSATIKEIDKKDNNEIINKEKLCSNLEHNTSILSDVSSTSNPSSAVVSSPNINSPLEFKIEIDKKGNKYEGQFKNGVRHGKGTMIYKNGYKYEGEWVNGLREGHGKYFIDNPDKKDTFEGEFKKGKAEGKGVANYCNGDKYEGDYKNWNKDGKGIYYYFNGDKYEGDFKDDQAEGRGKYFYKCGDKYEGDFKNNTAEGRGIYYYNSGEKKGDRYEGSFKNWNKEGKGVYYYKNGDRYEGDFRNDIREGKGIKYYKNGDREMGDYLNNKPIGKHAILQSNGKITQKNY